MGTQAYELMVFKKPQSKRINFSFRDDSTSDLDEFLEEDLWNDEGNSYDILYDTSMCRELVLNVIEPVFAQGEGYYTAIRCTGEQYHAVASKMLSTKGSSEKISKFLSEVFETDVSVKAGAFGAKQAPADNIFARYSKLIMGWGSGAKTKIVNKYLVVRMDSPKKTYRKGGLMFLVYSSILAILREPIIISGILQDEITNAEDLVRSLVSIGKLRFDGLPSGYDCWNLVGGTDLDRIRRELQEPFNGDGSDHASIATLALFILAFTQNLFKMTVPEFDDANGPVSYMEEYTLDSHKTLLLNKAKEMGLDLKYLGFNWRDHMSELISEVRDVFGTDTDADDETGDYENMDYTGNW